MSVSRTEVRAHKQRRALSALALGGTAAGASRHLGPEAVSPEALHVVCLGPPHTCPKAPKPAHPAGTPLLRSSGVLSCP